MKLFENSFKILITVVQISNLIKVHSFGRSCLQIFKYIIKEIVLWPFPVSNSEMNRSRFILLIVYSRRLLQTARHILLNYVYLEINRLCFKTNTRTTDKSVIKTLFTVVHPFATRVRTYRNIPLVPTVLYQHSNF